VTERPASDIVGMRRAGSQVETLTIPDDYWAGVDRDQALAVFRRQSIGPRLFLDAIAHDLEISPSFHDGHQVQRIVEASC
jgi:hypothetical protein